VERLEAGAEGAQAGKWRLDAPQKRRLPWVGASVPEPWVTTPYDPAVRAARNLKPHMT